jgi:hypothetical protein
LPSPEVLNALFQGAVVLLGALGLTAGARANRAAVRIRDHRALQRRYLVALSHIFTLETDLAERGAPVPRRPAEIEDSPDDGGIPPTPAPVGAG